MKIIISNLISNLRIQFTSTIKSLLIIRMRTVRYGFDPFSVPVGATSPQRRIDR